MTPLLDLYGGLVTTYGKLLRIIPMLITTMRGFRQTKTHRPGRCSYHEVGLFTGQPQGEYEDLEALLADMQKRAQPDTVELAAWDLDLRRADDDAGAAVYAQELFDLAQKYGMQIPSLATHLQGQCLGDRASVKTIQFQGGAVMAAYQQWLNTGNRPPEDDPYYVPSEVAEMSRVLAVKDLLAAGRLAQALSKIQERDVVVSSFVGSAGAWDDIFDFPPRPTKCGSKGDDGEGVEIEIGNRADYALQVIISRFEPVWSDYKVRGVKFGLESHPGEIAAGDIESTRRFLDATDAAGFNGTVGLNFDASHLVWQDVDPIEFIYEFIAYIWSVHHKGVQVRSRRRSRAGVFGGWCGFGYWTRFWDFVYASSNRDSTSPEEIIVTLNQLGWDGAITIEGEDTGFHLPSAIAKAIELTRGIDLPPATGLFDEAFAAK